MFTSYAYFITALLFFQLWWVSSEVMAQRNVESTLSEKSASLRSSASRRTNDTDSTASVDSDGNEGGKIGDSRDEFRALGGETVLTLGSTSVGKCLEYSATAILREI